MRPGTYSQAIGCRRTRRSASAALALLALGCMTAAAAVPGFVPDRLMLSVSGSTLEKASGGGSGSLTWLHSFNLDTLAGVGGEYDTIGNAHWELASLSAAFSNGQQANRWTIAADGRFGGGDIGTQRFDYDVEAVRFTDTVDGFISLTFESRQFDVYTTHGNLPKAGLSLFVAGHWILGAAYAHSSGGNLGTVYTSARLDHLGARVRWFVGGAQGHVAPPVLNIQTGATGAVPRYWDGYAGVAKTFTGTQWTVTADYLDLLGGTRRMTLTLTCSLQ
ncbi:MAG TPA: hypothetical protein VHY36_05735 [Steroidobacteraceae bacterium]|jgi:hypothetical protein|nr:hypothetical protein [Steroidobacteraceae bacterium]